MKTALEPVSKSKTFCNSKSYILLKKKETNLINFRFYQKLFVLLISFSTILKFPESPRELGNICEIHNSIKICNVW